MLLINCGKKSCVRFFEENNIAGLEIEPTGTGLVCTDACGNNLKVLLGLVLLGRKCNLGAKQAAN